tara:strand:- start:16147 stop:17280 length:1134 start_codon:yes stop_codon:yes gene_type:complete
MQKKLHNIEKQLNNNFVERSEEIHGLTIGLISGSNILYLGPPGVGKSLLVNSWSKLISKSNYFSWLLTAYSTPEELAGPYSLKGLEEDKFVRNTEGKLPEADIAFIDETWKGNSGVLNFLLTILNERIFYNDGKAQEIPLLTLVGASNELPEQGDGLEAMLDRFTLKFMVKPIKEASNFSKMLTTDMNNLSPVITIEELQQIKAEVDKVELNDNIVEILTNLKNKLSDSGLAVSDRTYKNSIKLLKAEAYYHERGEIIEDDLDILRHVLWSDPDEEKIVYSAILDLINPEKNKILELFDDAQEIYDSVIKLDSKDPQRLKKGVEVAVKLKEAKKKMHDFYLSLKNKGKDTKEVKKLEAKIDEYLTEVYNEACGVNFT